MATIDAVSGESLKDWSATAFFVAGGLWALGAALNYYELFVNVTLPGVAFGVFFLSAFLFTLIGVLGFYHPLSDRSPRLARTGVFLIAVAGIIILVNFGWFAVAPILNLAGTPPNFLGAFTLFAIILGLLVFGVASVWTDTPSRPAGLLLLTIVAIVLFFLAAIAGLHRFAPETEWIDGVVTTLFSAFSLAIGYLLRNDSDSTDRAASSPESIT